MKKLGLFLVGLMLMSFGVFAEEDFEVVDSDFVSIDYLNDREDVLVGSFGFSFPFNEVKMEELEFGVENAGVGLVEHVESVELRLGESVLHVFDGHELLDGSFMFSGDFVIVDGAEVSLYANFADSLVEVGSDMVLDIDLIAVQYEDLMIGDERHWPENEVFHQGAAAISFDRSYEVKDSYLIRPGVGISNRIFEGSIRYDVNDAHYNNDMNGFLFNVNLYGVHYVDLYEFSLQVDGGYTFGQVEDEFPGGLSYVFFGRLDNHEDNEFEFNITLQGDVQLEGDVFAEIVDVNFADEDVFNSVILSRSGLPLRGDLYGLSENGSDKVSDNDFLKTNYTSEYRPFDEQFFAENAGDPLNPFADIEGDGDYSERERAAIYLESKGVIKGYLKSLSPFVVEFRGDNVLNRAEAAKFIVNSMGLSEQQFCSEGRFPDVLEGEWYTKYVCTLNELGIISGHDDGYFRPADEVNQAEFTKMLLLAHNISLMSSGGEFWYSDYMETARANGFYDDYESPGEFLNRWETSVAVYRLMKAVGL